VSTTVEGPGPRVRHIDLPAAEAAARALLVAMGTDMDQEAIADTPRGASPPPTPSC
jgi:GTP cyclohydrolase I